MGTAHNYLAVLRDACVLRSEADFERYSEAIEALRADPSPDVLAGMLRCLRDVDAGEIQYELVEACEAYDGATYAREFAAAAEEIRAAAPHWGRLMFQSLLNSERHSQELALILQSAPSAVREACRTWASEIAAEYESGNKYARFAEAISAAD